MERAIDNLIKSGKLYSPGSGRGQMGMMGGGRGYDHGKSLVSRLEPARILTAVESRNRHSGGDFEHRGPGSHMQNYYSSQRYANRPNEAEQMMQAKRRMAAQRERELRNYHQEQQYNRSEWTARSMA